jgi:uncharacterized protein
LQVRIGVVSDTHGHLGNTQRAVDVLGNEQVECVLHCGDIGSAEVIPLFGDWPTHFVFGNCDHDQESLTHIIDLCEQTSHGLFGSIELAGCPIALLHSHEPRRLGETIASQNYRLVCYGHTHLREFHYEGETLVLNPGALYRANPHTVAIVELPQLAVRSIELT